MLNERIPQEYQINPLARFRWKNDEGLVYQDMNNGREYSVDESVLTLLLGLKAPVTKASITDVIIAKVASEKKAGQIFKKLLEINLLVGVGNHKKDYTLWLERNWRNALYFHLKTSDVEFVDMGQKNEQSAKVKLLKEYASESKIPEFFKSYKNQIKLPKPKLGHVPVGHVLLNRRTTRRFGGAPITLEQLSTILHYTCQPVKLVREHVMKLSQDNPLLLVLSSYTPYEIYFSASNIQGLEKGLYHYDMRSHAVSLIKAGDYDKDMRRIAIGQGVDSCAAVFMISSCFERYMWRYRNSRAYRNLLIEAASLGHRIIMSAEAVGLKNFLTPAIRDSMADELFELDGIEESMTYLVAVGTKFENNT